MIKNKGSRFSREWECFTIYLNNKYFLLAVQHGLLEHETLLNSDLAKIRESCI